MMCVASSLSRIISETKITSENMDNEKKRAKVIKMIDDLYGDSGMAVVNLMTDYMSEADWGHLYDRLDRDGAFRD